MESKCCSSDIVNHWGYRCSSCHKSTDEFIRTAAQENIDPDYVKAVGGISGDLFETLTSTEMNETNQNDQDSYHCPDPIRIQRAKITIVHPDTKIMREYA